MYIYDILDVVLNVVLDGGVIILCMKYTSAILDFFLDIETVLEAWLQNSPSFHIHNFCIVRFYKEKYEPV